MANNKSDHYQYKFCEISYDPDILSRISDSLIEETPEEIEEWEPGPDEIEEYQARLYELPPRQRQALEQWLLTPRYSDVSAAIGGHPDGISRLIRSALKNMGVPPQRISWLTTKKGWLKKED